jgi:hypothetical protein
MQGGEIQCLHQTTRDVLHGLILEVCMGDINKWFRTKRNANITSANQISSPSIVQKCALAHGDTRLSTRNNTS